MTKQPLPKAALLAELGASRAELEAVLSRVPAERMTEPGACGTWSVKDVLTHIAVGNDWLALQLKRRTRGEAPGPDELQRDHELGLDNNETRNAYYAQLHRDLDLEYVPDWWTFGRALGSVFDTDHDREHAQTIQQWLGQV